MNGPRQIYCGRRHANPQAAGLADASPTSCGGGGGTIADGGATNGGGGRRSDGRGAVQTSPVPRLRGEVDSPTAREALEVRALVGQGARRCGVGRDPTAPCIVEIARLICSRRRDRPSRGRGPAGWRHSAKVAVTAARERSANECRAVDVLATGTAHRPGPYYSHEAKPYSRHGRDTLGEVQLQSLRRPAAGVKDH